jgi:tetratricopeptide (TPR) repeat protein
MLTHNRAIPIIDLRMLQTLTTASGQPIMSETANSVFISYRRSVSAFIARAIFQDLSYHGYDVFMDIESIDSGQFDTVILNQIAARPHFLVILTPGAVERCLEPEDWLRREIEHAMALERNVVPVIVNNFDFRESGKYLTGELENLSRYNALDVPFNYFDAAMERLRNRFLTPSEHIVQTIPTPVAEQPIVQHKLNLASSQPVPHKAQLDAEEYYNRGHQQWEAGHFANAIADCNRAIELNPEFAEAYSRRGTAYIGQSDYDQALEDFTQAIQLSPEYAAAHFNRGLAQAAKGDYASALADYNEALRLNPLFASAYYSRALARTAGGDYRGAAADYGKYLDLGGAESFGNRAEVEEAIQHLRDRWQR